MHFLIYLLAALAQAPDTGAFVITLGKDTIGVERFTRTADRLVDDMVMRDRAPAITRHLVAQLGADGTITSLAFDTKPVGPPDAPPVHTAARYTGDEVYIDLTRDGRTTASHVDTPHGVLPFINYCYALYAQFGVRARKLGGSPVTIAVLNFSSATPFDLTVTFPSPDSMGVAFPGDPPTLFKVDAAGRIHGADGRLTTQKVIVTRVPSVDLEAFAAAAGGRPLGQLSPPDSVRAQVAGTDIAIYYSRPSMRGRKIFGGVVPWDKVWRTGANFATRFSTSADLEVAGKTIPKGTYTLWTLPSRAGWKLIVSRQTLAPCDGEACIVGSRPRLWGTDYAADSDLVRVDVQTEQLPEPVEQFTIAIVPQGKGGLIRMDWEATRIAIPFTRKQAS